MLVRKLVSGTIYKICGAIYKICGAIYKMNVAILSYLNHVGGKHPQSSAYKANMKCLQSVLSQAPDFPRSIWSFTICRSAIATGNPIAAPPKYIKIFSLQTVAMSPLSFGRFCLLRFALRSPFGRLGLLVLLLFGSLTFGLPGLPAFVRRNFPLTFVRLLPQPGARLLLGLRPPKKKRKWMGVQSDKTSGFWIPG